VSLKGTANGDSQLTFASITSINSSISGCSGPSDGVLGEILARNKIG
jgi:hypothetical protein